MSKKILVIGAGYVGLITGVGYAKLGHSVDCFDVDEKKLEQINRKKPPFYEPGLQEELNDLVGVRLFTKKSLVSEFDYDVAFICVGTPSAEDGSANLSFLRAAAESIAVELKQGKYTSIIVKSTVPPGTTQWLAPLIEQASGKKLGKEFGLGMMPEFLREGSALKDFFEPDRIVIGAIDDKTRALLRELHKDAKCSILETNATTAETIKYASNAFLATKLSFINEMADLCEKLGIDVLDLARGAGLDKRIGLSYFNASLGYGGSCLPKDLRSLTKTFEKNGLQPVLLKTVQQVNALRPEHFIEIAEQKIDLRGKKVCVLGLAFKRDTDDIRESPAIALIQKLLEKNCAVQAFDSQAMENMKKIFPQIKYCSTMKEALTGADACFIAADWPEFDNAEAYKVLKNRVVIDGKRVLDAKQAKKAGIKYAGIGVGWVN